MKILHFCGEEDRWIRYFIVGTLCWCFLLANAFLYSFAISNFLKYNKRRNIVWLGNESSDKINSSVT